MKKSEVIAAVNYLRTIKVGKIADCGVRDAIFNDLFVLLPVARTANQEVRDAREAALGSFAGEAEEVERLRSKLITSTDAAEQKAIGREISTHDAYFSAMGAFNKKVAELLDKDVEVKGLRGIDRAAFLAELGADSEETFGQIEAIFPLFEIASNAN